MLAFIISISYINNYPHINRAFLIILCYNITENNSNLTLYIKLVIISRFQYFFSQNAVIVLTLLFKVS